MDSKIIIDGNAFYEIDEECMKKAADKKDYGKPKEMNTGKRRGLDSENKKVRTS